MKFEALSTISERMLPSEFSVGSNEPRPPIVAWIGGTAPAADFARSQAVANSACPTLPRYTTVRWPGLSITEP